MCTNVCLSNVYQCVPYFNVYLVHFTTIQCLRLSSPSSAAFSQAVQLLGIEIQIQYKNSWKTQIYFSLLYSTIYLAAVFCLYLLFLELHCSGLASVQIRKQFFTQQQNTLCELINSQWWADTGNKIQTELSRLVLVFIRFGINDLPDRDFGRHSLDFLDLKLILESLPRFGSDFVQSVFISLPVRRRCCCMLETTKLFGKLCFS